MDTTHKRKYLNYFKIWPSTSIQNLVVHKKSHFKHDFLDWSRNRWFFFKSYQIIYARIYVQTMGKKTFARMSFNSIWNGIKMKRVEHKLLPTRLIQIAYHFNLQYNWKWGNISNKKWPDINFQMTLQDLLVSLSGSVLRAKKLGALKQCWGTCGMFQSFKGHTCMYYVHRDI